MKKFALPFLLMLSISGYAQTFLDSTFADNGVIITPGDNTGNNKFLSIITQPDGKIVAGGFSEGGAIITRFNVDGSFDNSFATGGSYATPFTGSVYSLALQTDGKIINAGYPNFRLNSDGTLDTAFGTNGNDSIGGNAVAMQIDGKILIAGTDLSGIYLTVTRLNDNGLKDSTFGNNGIVTSSFAGRAYGVAQMTDGRIVVSGYNQPQYKLLAMRLLPDGSADTSFNHSGINSMFGGDSYNIATAMLLQPNGKIIVAGSGTRGSEGENFTMVRFSRDGSIDRSFGDTGVVSIDFAGDDDRINALCQAANGEIVAAGFSTIDHHKRFALARTDSNGQIDGSFGISGRITTPLQDTGDIGYAAVIQADGKIVVAGGSGDAGGFHFLDLAIARYLDFFPEGLATAKEQPAPVLFPNPAGNALHLLGNLQGLICVSACDIAGHNVALSVDITSGNVFLGDIAPGIYLFTFSFSDGHTVIQKIVVQ